MASQSGTLYGIGVGPGDPDLITVKAVKILRQVSTVFAAGSTKNGYSLARDIVKEYVGETQIEKMSFPMTRDKKTLTEAWEGNARRALEVVEAGTDAAFVTLGDPLTYSTFSYLLRTVKRLAPHIRIVTVPGITSYQAAAAMSNMPIAEGEESVHLISGAKGGATLRKAIDSSENIVMLKTYKHFDDIYQTLEDLGLLDHCVLFSRLGLDGESVVQDLRSLKSKKMPYLSLLIVKRNGLVRAALGARAANLPARRVAPQSVYAENPRC
ncbi:MAG: precorrin-2 C(20)-methyltransferase [Desulfomonilaceae bacterium]|nr:precorrin-2 C(20)-methyltransferase [Desulfomonilaceae bacterium]